MRRLVYALSATTLIFAASTVYLARALQLERARGEADSRAATNAMPAPPGAEAGARHSAPPLATSKPPQPGTGTMRGELKRASPGSVNIVSQASPDPAKQLAQLMDPVQRTGMIEERKSSYRTVYTGLAEHLRMDDAEFERFIEAVANQELNMQEAHLRCYIDKTCGTRDVSDQIEAGQRELIGLFGAEKVQAFKHFQHTMGERQFVSQLRGRLPDKLRLLDAQSESLIDALNQESQRIRADSQQRGLQVSNFNNLVYTPDPGAPDAEKDWQAANEYNRMMRDRVATVLTPEQLAIYEKMQNDALQSFRSMEISMARQRSQEKDR